MLAVFSRYVVAGSTAVLVRFAILILLVEYWAVRPIVASVLGYVVSILINYTLQYYWSFNSDVEHRIAFARYLAIAVTMLGFNSAVFWTCNEIFDVHYVLSQIIATGLVVIFTFTINRRYTFVST